MMQGIDPSQIDWENSDKVCKVTLNTLVSSREAIRRLAAQPFPATVTFRLMPFVEEAERHITHYFETARKIYLDNGGVDEGAMLAPPTDPDARKIVDEEMLKLNRMVVDVTLTAELRQIANGAHPSVREDEKIRLTVSDLMTLGWCRQGEDPRLTIQRHQQGDSHGST